MATVAFQSIVQGEDRTLPLQVQRSDGGSFDLSSVTEITAKFVNQDASILSLTKTGGAVVVTDGPAGRFTVSISDTQSAALRLLNPVSAQDFTVVIDSGSDRRIVNFTKGLKVVAEAV
jgi:hypothetical protein